MEWSSELLKYLTSSKSLIVASFFTSVALIFGEGTFFPDEIAPQGYVKLILIGVAIFTGILLVIVAFDLLSKLAQTKLRAILKAWRGRELTDSEKAIILGMATKANEPTNFSLADYSKAEFTKLEVLSIVQELRNKGYVEDYLFDETIAYLTPKGRIKALELMAHTKKMHNQASQHRALRALDGLSGASRLQGRRCWRR